MWKELKTSDDRAFDFVIKPLEVTVKINDKTAYIGGELSALANPDDKDYMYCSYMGR